MNPHVWMACAAPAPSDTAAADGAASSHPAGPSHSTIVDNCSSIVMHCVKPGMWRRADCESRRGNVSCLGSWSLLHADQACCCKCVSSTRRNTMHCMRMCINHNDGDNELANLAAQVPGCMLIVECHTRDVYLSKTFAVTC